MRHKILRRPPRILRLGSSSGPKRECFFIFRQLSLHRSTRKVSANTLISSIIGHAHYVPLDTFNLIRPICADGCVQALLQP